VTRRSPAYLSQYRGAAFRGTCARLSTGHASQGSAASWLHLDATSRKFTMCFSTSSSSAPSPSLLMRGEGGNVSTRPTSWAQSTPRKHKVCEELEALRSRIEVAPVS